VSPTLLILAAGLGSRYGGLKQMEAVGPGGATLMDYAVFDAVRAGFGEVVFVIRPEMEAAFADQVLPRFRSHVPVRAVLQRLDVPPGYSVPAQRRKPWGTAHAVLSAAPAVDGPFAVVNADDFYGRASYAVLGEFLDRTTRPTEYALVGFTLRQTLSEQGRVARGVCAVGPDGLLRAAVEHTRIEPQGEGARYLDQDGQWRPLTGDETVSLNMWGFQPSLFAQLAAAFEAFLRELGADPAAEFYIPTAVTALIARGAVTARVLATPERWFGVTYPLEKAAVAASIRELVRAGVYPACLWEGSV